MNDLPITIRPAVDTDYGYILATWTRSHHKVHPFNFISNDLYFPYQTKLINKILAKATTMVVCLDDEPNQIVGYVVYENYANDIVIHHAAVKGIFRRLGIMRFLLKEIGAVDKSLIVTHYFDLFKKIRDKYKLIYDPIFLERYL